MGNLQKLPYPPCCTQQECRGGGKFQWPELVGQNGEKAKAVIEKDNPYVTVVPLSVDGGARLFDICYNRVYLWIDKKGNVAGTPVVD